MIWTVGGGSPVPNKDEAGNQIARVSVDANRITIGNAAGSQPPEAGGITIIGGMGSNARNGSIKDIQLVNDAIGPGPSQIILTGGANGASGNQLDDVKIVNDTIAGRDGRALQVTSNDKGAVMNSISGVTITNTILWGSIDGEVTPSMIRSSIVSQSNFAGVNGNIAADPKFVDAADGDFHLQAESPAIDAGTWSGAPATDIDGRARSDGHVDIGAYESARHRRTYAVSVSVVGNGLVTSRPAGISCPSRCVHFFAAGTTLRLSATPRQRSRFAGWRRHCAGTKTCTLTVTSAQSVSAVFRSR